MLNRAALRGAGALGLGLAMTTATISAQEGAVPTGIPRLNHVFVIMMENHGFSQIRNNPNAPFANALANTANVANNYYAIAHPSLTNYLEIVGGSNFGIHTDNYPDWHNTSCATNLSTGIPATDNPPTGLICPIAGVGTDAATPAIDYTNETQNPAGEISIDGVQSIPSATGIVGKTIAEQLVAAGRVWKTYQEDLPLTGPDQVNISDGFFSNLTNFSAITPPLNPPLTSKGIVALYAVKHNPFVYFLDVEQGYNKLDSYSQVVPFDGPSGLYADLARGTVPSYSFIAPNQCNDQHGRGNAGPFCNYDPNDNGTQAGLNPALIQRGDITLHRLVYAIKSSPVWQQGRTAIVIVWDENDYSIAPITNQVLAIVYTNYGIQQVASNHRYTHFSLLKSIEGGFGLPCLNHACDANVDVMADLFAVKQGQ